MKTFTMNAAANTTRTAIASRMAAFALVWVGILGMLTQDDDSGVSSPAIMRAFRAISDVSSRLPVPFWGCIIGCAVLTMLLVAWSRKEHEATREELAVSHEEAVAA